MNNSWAIAHDVFDKSCGVKAEHRGSEDAAIEARRGVSCNIKGAKDHAVFDSS